jgi:hypothetical protein
MKTKWLEPYFRVMCRWSPPSHAKPHLSCSFHIASNFALTILLASHPAYKDAQAVRMISLAGITSLHLIPRLPQNARYSHNQLASFSHIVLFTAAKILVPETLLIAPLPIQNHSNSSKFHLKWFHTAYIASETVLLLPITLQVHCTVPYILGLRNSTHRSTLPLTWFCMVYVTSGTVPCCVCHLWYDSALSTSPLTWFCMLNVLSDSLPYEYTVSPSLPFL